MEKKNMFAEASQKRKEEQDNLKKNLNNNDSTSIMIDSDKLISFHTHEKNNPYNIDFGSDNFKSLKESIKQNGILEPLIVRLDKDNDGFYEIISGHRRKLASDQIGNKKLPVKIKDLSDEEAIVMLVDSNIYRDEISVMEKAWSYRMKYDALKKLAKNRQGFRTDLHNKEHSGQLVQNVTSLDELSKESDDNYKTIQRYIRLTYLIEELQNLVNEGKIKFLVGVELSYLREEEQNNISDLLLIDKLKIDLDKAKELKETSKKKELTIDDIKSILEPFDKKIAFRFNEKKLDSYLPIRLKCWSPTQKMELIENAVKEYLKSHYSEEVYDM